MSEKKVSDWMPIKEAAEKLGFAARGYFCHTRERDVILTRLGIQGRKIGRRFYVLRADVARILSPEAARKRKTKARSSENTKCATDVAPVVKL